MSKKFSIIYLSIAPVLFALSYFISTKLYKRFMQFGTGDYEYQGKDHSLVYSLFFTGLYLVIYFVIRDLYKKKA